PVLALAVVLLQFWKRAGRARTPLTGCLVTLRWRKPDSNPRSPWCRAVVLNARSALRRGRCALLDMRNTKPAAKKSRLYDPALTSISSVRGYPVGSVKGSRDVSRSQITRSRYRTSRRGWHG